MNNFNNKSKNIYENITKDYNFYPIITKEPETFNIYNLGTDYIKEILKTEPLLMNHLSKNYNYFQLKESFNDVRYYKDTSTSVFNEVFFKNKEKLNLFLYYTYQLINYDITTQINEKLYQESNIYKESDNTYQREWIYIFNFKRWKYDVYIF